MKFTSILILLLLALLSIASPSMSKPKVDARSGRYTAIAASIERNITPANRKLLRLHSGSSTLSSLKSVARAVYQATLDLSLSLSTLTLASTIPKVKAMPDAEERRHRLLKL
jgi:hypothetical protein